MNIDDLMSLYVLLWSPSQKCFHIELVSEMILENIQVYYGNLPGDYIVLQITNSHEEAANAADELNNKLNELKEKHDID